MTSRPIPQPDTRMANLTSRLSAQQPIWYDTRYDTLSVGLETGEVRSRNMTSLYGSMMEKIEACERFLSNIETIHVLVVVLLLTFDETFKVCPQL